MALRSGTKIITSYVHSSSSMKGNVGVCYVRRQCLCMPKPNFFKRGNKDQLTYTEYDIHLSDFENDFHFVGAILLICQYQELCTPNKFPMPVMSNLAHTQSTWMIWSILS